MGIPGGSNTYISKQKRPLSEEKGLLLAQVVGKHILIISMYVKKMEGKLM